MPLEKPLVSRHQQALSRRSTGLFHSHVLEPRRMQSQQPPAEANCARSDQHHLPLLLQKLCDAAHDRFDSCFAKFTSWFSYCTCAKLDDDASRRTQSFAAVLLALLFGGHIGSLDCASGNK